MTGTNGASSHRAPNRKQHGTGRLIVRIAITGNWTFNVDAIWLTESDVVGMMSLKEALAALEQGLIAEANGKAQNMVKTHTGWGPNNLHAIGAQLPRSGHRWHQDLGSYRRRNLSAAHSLRRRNGGRCER